MHNLPPPSPLPEYSYSASSTQPRNTGCDIYHYSGNDYRVSVWEPNGTTVAIGWDVDYGGNNYTGTSALSYTSGIGDPDVCLVEKTGDIFAIVAYYYVPSTRWYWETWVFDPMTTSFIPFTGASVLDSGPFGTTINVDGNEQSAGEFAIVWDDNNGNIWTSVGDMSSYILGSRINIASGTYPDVSMYYDGSNDVVHFAYVDVSGALLVDDHQFATLASGSASSGVGVFNYAPGGSNQYYYPRIASPKGSTGSPSEWTTVVEETDNSTVYLITGFNNAVATPIYYNDGTNSPFADISMVPNYHVSVTYTDKYSSDGIWVGWNFDDTYGSISGYYTNQVNYASYSIVLKCDNTSIPVSGATYWQVPNGITSGNGDLSGFMSMAGRYGNDELFLTYVNVILNGSSIDDVFYKKVPNSSGASSFKTNNNLVSSPITTCFNIIENLVFINEMAATVEFELYNLEGKLLNKKVLKSLTEFKEIETLCLNLQLSVYLIKFRNIDNGETLNAKILVGK